MELLRIYPGIYFEYFAVFYWLWHDRGGMEQTAHSFICDSTLRSHQTHLRLLLFLRRHTRAFGTNIKWLDVVGGWKEAEIERRKWIVKRTNSLIHIRLSPYAEHFHMTTTAVCIIYFYTLPATNGAKTKEKKERNTITWG